MEFWVRGTMHDEHDAQAAFDSLLSLGYTERDITFRARLTAPYDSGPPAGYDPVGGARLVGRTVSTLAATGHNLVGNSTNLDVPLGRLGEILAQAASDEADANGQDGAELRLDCLVRAPRRAAADEVADILRQHGAKHLKIKAARGGLS